jgi:RNA polymerase sigma factor (sigma-70 family)
LGSAHEDLPGRPLGFNDDRSAFTSRRIRRRLEFLRKGQVHAGACIGSFTTGELAVTENLKSTVRKPPDEAAWAQIRDRCIEGQEDAWRELDAAIRPRMLSLFRRLAGNKEVASDLSQTLFLRLCEDGGRRLRKYDPGLRVPFAAYLHVIAVRLYRDWLRSREALDCTRWVDLADADAIIPESAADPDLLCAIDRALAALSEGERLPLLLAARGLRYDEIARTIGLTPGGAAARISRARTRVREMVVASGRVRFDHASLKPDLAHPDKGERNRRLPSYSQEEAPREVDGTSQ